MAENHDTRGACVDERHVSPARSTGARLRRLRLRTALAILLAVAAPCSATVKNWIGATDSTGVWDNDGSKWSPAGTPTAAHDVVFPVGSGSSYKVEISINATAGSVTLPSTVTLEIRASKRLEVGYVDVDGVIIVKSGGRLELNACATSSNDGLIDLVQASATIRISAETHTINGSGSILGRLDSVAIQLSSGAALTNQTTIGGSLKIEPVAGATGTCFSNSTGGVVATAGGTLLVNSHVLGSGSGEWRVTGSGATLEFDCGSTSLSGNFTVSAGTLKIDASVCTSGNLTFSGGKIQVAAGKSFQTGGTCRSLDDRPCNCGRWRLSGEGHADAVLLASAGSLRRSVVQQDGISTPSCGLGLVLSRRTGVWT